MCLVCQRLAYCPFTLLINLLNSCSLPTTQPLPYASPVWLWTWPPLPCTWACLLMPILWAEAWLWLCMRFLIMSLIPLLLLSYTYLSSTLPTAPTSPLAHFQPSGFLRLECQHGCGLLSFPSITHHCSRRWLNCSVRPAVPIFLLHWGWSVRTAKTHSNRCLACTTSFRLGKPCK